MSKAYITKERAMELVSIAMSISMNGCRDIFIEYFPHVDVFEVSIHKEGWTRNSDYDVRYKFYTTKDKEKLDIEGTETYYKCILDMERI